MTVSVGVLSVIIIFATILVAIAPITLVVLWLKDLKEEKLW